MTVEISLKELDIFGEVFWKNTSGCRVFSFHGPLGAGKTTMIKTICQHLGVPDTVSSPTFSIINEYSYIKDGREHKLFHMDLYRLDDMEEAMQTGVEDVINSDAICFVEWPEKAPGLFDENTMQVHIEMVDETTRRVTMNKGSL